MATCSVFLSENPMDEEFVGYAIHVSGKELDMFSDETCKQVCSNKPYL